VQRGVEELFLVGPETLRAAEGASEAGLAERSIKREDSFERLADMLLRTLSKGDWLLIKGSRSNKLDIIAGMLAEKTKQAAR
ncbi:MAG: hypothetical protein C0609_08170, partial [Deltaproteobacteria bacterium]